MGRKRRLGGDPFLVAGSLKELVRDATVGLDFALVPAHGGSGIKGLVYFFGAGGL